MASAPNSDCHHHPCTHLHTDNTKGKPCTTSLACRLVPFHPKETQVHNLTCLPAFLQLHRRPASSPFTNTLVCDLDICFATLREFKEFMDFGWFFCCVLLQIACLYKNDKNNSSLFDTTSHPHLSSLSFSGSQIVMYLLDGSCMQSQGMIISPSAFLSTFYDANGGWPAVFIL